MLQHGANRVSQQNQAKYSRMEPVHIRGDSNSVVTFSETITSQTSRPAHRSNGSKPESDRNRNLSTGSNESLTDDLAAVEAEFADAEWLEPIENDTNEAQRSSGFPVGSPIRNAITNSSPSSVYTPTGGKVKFYVDKINREDEIEDGSLTLSVYDNCANHNQNFDGRNDKRSGPRQAEQCSVQKCSKLNSEALPNEEPASNQNLTVPTLESLSTKRKTGNAGSVTDMNSTYQADNHLVFRQSSKRLSRSPTPRRSFIDGVVTTENDPATALDDAEKKEKIHSGPSSRRTVLMIAGLFAVGLIFILSGIIVLTVEHHTAFRVVGCLFLGVGITFFIICLFLQKKNVKKLVNQLENDLYFLNVTDNKVWNMIFHFDEQLRWS